MTTFTRGAATITLGYPQSRPFQADSSIPQQTGMVTTGAIYAYDRSGATVRTLAPVWPRVTAVELAALKTFLTGTVGGARQRFTWTDDLGIVRTVRYVNLTWQETGPDRFRVTLNLEESV